MTHKQVGTKKQIGLGIGKQQEMSTRTDAVLPPLVLERRASRARAKETAAAAPPSGDRMTRKRTSSWDPYEVWKTRVKGPSGSG